MLALAQRLKTFSPGSDTGLALGVAALIAVLVATLFTQYRLRWR